MKSYKNIMLTAICLTKTIQTSEVSDALELASLLPQKKEVSEKTKQHVHGYVEKFRKHQEEKKHIQKKQTEKEAIHNIKSLVHLDENDNIQFSDLKYHAIMASLNQLPEDMLINLGNGVRWEVREIKEALEKHNNETLETYPNLDNFDNPKSEFLTRREIDKAEEAVRLEIKKAQAIAQQDLDKAQNASLAETRKREDAAKKIADAYRSKKQLGLKQDIKEQLQQEIYLTKNGEIALYKPENLQEVLRTLDKNLSKYDTLTLATHDDKIKKDLTAQDIYLALADQYDADSN